jgi:hypothetical protein
MSQIAAEAANSITAYMLSICRLRELEQLRLDRTIRRLKSVYFMAGIGVLFAGVYVTAPPSTHTTTTTAPTTSSVEV